jgi:hypothetical protein
MAEDGTSCIVFFTSSRLQTFPLWLDSISNQTHILDPACDHEALATHHEDFHHLGDPSTGSSSVGHPYRTKTLSALPDRPVDGVERGGASCDFEEGTGSRRPNEYFRGTLAGWR